MLHQKRLDILSPEKMHGSPLFEGWASSCVTWLNVKNCVSVGNDLRSSVQNALNVQLAGRSARFKGATSPLTASASRVCLHLRSDTRTEIRRKSFSRVSKCSRESTTPKSAADACQHSHSATIVSQNMPGPILSVSDDQRGTQILTFSFSFWWVLTLDANPVTSEKPLLMCHHRRRNRQRETETMERTAGRR